MMKRRYIYQKVLGLALAALTFTACTDTWDDHYEGTATGVNEGSLWKAIKQNPNLSNFASVIEATGFDKQLGSSQVFTVFAPTNDALSAAEAEALISQYKTEKQQVKDVDNTVLNQFVKNHVALYNHSVSSASNDSIKLMNGKYAVLKYRSIEGVAMDSAHSNKLYKNGLLFTVNQKLAFRPNLFEYVRMDASLDSLRNFFYSGDSLHSNSPWKLYYKEFLSGSSVEGGLDSLGRMTYLDSVFQQQSKVFNYIDKVDSEDSVFWMLAPTNEAWDSLLTQYQPYFKYSEKVEKRDSLSYFYPRAAIVKGTTFSRTLNKGVFNKEVSAGEVADSAISVNATANYTLRKARWGHQFNYFEYYNAWQPGGVFSQGETVDCSNGVVRKLTKEQWPIDEKQSFAQYIVIEAEESGNLFERQYVDNSQTGDRAYYVSLVKRNVVPDTAANYYNKVWNNSFVECYPITVDQLNYNFTYKVPDVLSNFGYDIYVVTVPARAYTKYLTVQDFMPTVIRCTLSYPDEKGTVSSKTTKSSSAVTVDPDSIQYYKVFEDFKFPVSNYGLDEIEPSVKFKIETRVSSTQFNNGYTRMLRLDCILLVPHGTIIPETYNGNPSMLLKPHGDAYWQHHMLR